MGLNWPWKATVVRGEEGITSTITTSTVNSPTSFVTTGLTSRSPCPPVSPWILKSKLSSTGCPVFRLSCPFNYTGAIWWLIILTIVSLVKVQMKDSSVCTVQTMWRPFPK
uniref:Uncharacterized protein n=1 Tax=Cacopsylla melanoneura TaxID=428564 RepID=A0A8D8XC42_9HEMI